MLAVWASADDALPLATEESAAASSNAEYEQPVSTSPYTTNVKEQDKMEYTL